MKKNAFTLVELLVVMAIIGVLVTLVAASFRSAQLRGRDAQRKSDLRNTMNSLELFFSDYGRYPASDGNGGIAGCPYDPTTGMGQPCSWGLESFTDGKTTYFKVLPQDPATNQTYYYRVIDSPTNQKVQLFARLENSKDPDCIDGNCVNPTTYLCGTSATCNFSITSPNTTPTE